MKRALVIAALVWLLLLVLLLSSIKDWLWTHPWWHSFLVALPGIVAAAIALLELRHSGEANELRRQNNELRKTLDSERNQNLQDIAKHTKPQPNAAERMAAKLWGYIGQSATVSEGKGVWGSSIQIAEVSDDSIVTLFSPAGYSSTQAWAVKIHCNDLKLVDIGGRLRLRVNKRYGDTVDLGNLKWWEDRNQRITVPEIPEKGHCAFLRDILQTRRVPRRGSWIFTQRRMASRPPARPSESLPQKGSVLIWR